MPGIAVVARLPKTNAAKVMKESESESEKSESVGRLSRGLVLCCVVCVPIDWNRGEGDGRCEGVE